MRIVIRVSGTAADVNVAPIAWPIAKLLDYVLGKSETHTYKKAELKCVSLALAGAPLTKLASLQVFPTIPSPRRRTSPRR